MGNRPNPRPAWYFDLAAFLAILVTAIILISVVPADPQVVQSVVDLAAAYLAVRVAGDRRPAQRRRGS
jgi:hypothetical protein